MANEVNGKQTEVETSSQDQLKLFDQKVVSAIETRLNKHVPTSLAEIRRPKPDKGV